MPAWMHDRAEHILAKNPSMPKSEAFAIATQQMHALGKGPKSYGTSEGKRVAKAKYSTPKDDKKTANPGGLRTEKMAKEASMDVMKAAFFDELQQIKDAGVLDSVKKALTTPIPGTPELFPHTAVDAATRFAKKAPAVAEAAKKVPADWRASRAAAWNTPQKTS